MYSLESARAGIMWRLFSLKRRYRMSSATAQTAVIAPVSTVMRIRRRRITSVPWKPVEEPRSWGSRIGGRVTCQKCHRGDKRRSPEIQLTSTTMHTAMSTSLKADPASQTVASGNRNEIFSTSLIISNQIPEIMAQIP